MRLHITIPHTLNLAVSGQLENSTIRPTQSEHILTKNEMCSFL